MAEFAIEAQPRSMTGKKVRRLRGEGLIPGIVYGPSMEPVSVQLPERRWKSCSCRPAAPI